MPPPATTPVQLTDLAGVQQVFGRNGVNIRLDADRSTVVSTAENAVLTFCLNYGSELTFAYCGTRIGILRLQNSWLAYWWASIIAAYLLAMFRQGAIPASLQAEYEATLRLLEQIHVGQFKPASMPNLSGSGSSIDNIRMDNRFRVKQMRVEQTISDGHQAQASPVAVEILSQYIFERNN